MGCLSGGEYIFVVESKLQSEGLPFVKSRFGSLKSNMPNGKIIIGQGNFHLRVVFLDALELLLEAL